MRTRVLLAALPALLLLLAQRAQALPGSHAPAVSTYDTRASSVVLAYRHGSSDAGPFNWFSYNANFTNTTGKLSAQFGIHYVNFAPKVTTSTAHGIGASGVAVFVFPVAGRYDNGLPKAALSFDVGAVPTVYVSGQHNYFTLPLVIGFGVPLSPHRSLTFTPSFEIAPSANLDTVIRPANVQVGSDAIIPSAECSSSDPAIRANCHFDLNQSAVEAAVKNGVTINYGFAVPMRAALEAALHVSDSADLNAYTAISSLGGGFSGKSLFSLGVGLVFRWDDIVPAVLPAERRLEHEDCEAIEHRFRSCPVSRRWLSPEQRTAAPEPAPAIPAESGVLPQPLEAPPAVVPSQIPATPAVPSTSPATVPETSTSPGSAAFPN